MVLLSIFFTRIRSTEGSSADCSLFILSLHALFIKRLKWHTSNLSVWRFEHVGLTYICQLYFPPECQQDHLRYATNTLLSENIPNIWHKSSTKHKEVRPDWNDKNDNANYAPSYLEGVLPMARVAILKKYSIKCERFRLNCFLFWTKTSQRLTLYLYLATDNIHIVLARVPC